MEESASTVRDDFRDFALRMADAFARFPELRAEEEELRRLASAIYEPFTLAVFGYMKTGKSSLINALVGKPLAITGTDETTATLNWISHGTREQEETFLVNWKDGSNEPFPIERLKDWTGKSEEALALCARTARIDLYATREVDGAVGSGLAGRDEAAAGQRENEPTQVQGVVDLDRVGGFVGRQRRGR